jgi:transposase-like protein
MVKQEKKFYSEGFKEQVLQAYLNSDETMAEIASRFHLNKGTMNSWVSRYRKPDDSEKSVKLASEKTDTMKKEEMSSEAKDARIQELEDALFKEKMRSESLEKMIEIAERELKIDIRKKSGAKRSMK